MKKSTLYLLSFFLLNVFLGHSQVSVTIDGNSVNLGDTYQYMATSPAGSGDYDIMELEVENLSSNDMDMTVERCRIIDSPDWVLYQTKWYPNSLDPIIGFCIPTSAMMDSCWMAPSGPAISTSEKSVMQDYWLSTDTSCVLFRYNFWNGTTLEGYVDIEYCGTSLASTTDLMNTEVSVFPNPASQNLVIQSDYLGESEYSISSVSGQIVYSGTMINGQEVLDVTLLKNGYYVLSIQGNTGMINRKLVIRH